MNLLGWRGKWGKAVTSLLLRKPPRVSSRCMGGALRGVRRIDFEKLHVDVTDTDVVDPVAALEERPQRTTQFFRDGTKTIIARNESPDVGFETSLNPYRGCEHGCIYCFARPTHEYLGFSAGLDFESRIMVKMDAPKLLEAELSSPKWEPRVIMMSGVTDPYQPVERKLRPDTRLSRSISPLSKPDRDDHEESVDHARHRFAERTRESTTRSG